MVFLKELEQNILQCVWKYKTPWRAKTILRKKSRSWQDQAPWLQIITQAIVIKTLVLPQKSKLGLSQLVSSSIRWWKYWSFSFSISPSNEYSGLISFRIDLLDLFAVQGTLKSPHEYHSSKASILRCSAFFLVQLSHTYMTTGKTIALTRQTFVG